MLKGRDCIINNYEPLSSLGTKALIVTGRNSAQKCGALGDVEEALRRGQTGYVIFNKIEENPSVETVLAAADIGRQQGVDFVIGIGGGSPMDAAKAIALLIKNPGATAEDIYGGRLPAEWLPVVAVPTTCGTGSEVTGVSVLTRHDKHTKQSIPYKIYPDQAYIDGKYLKTASMAMIRNTAFDALAHLYEAYLNTKANGDSNKKVDEGLKTWASCRQALTHTCAADIDDGALQQLMEAAMQAGEAIAIAGTALPHAMSYPLTYEKGTPHSAAVGQFLAGYLRHAPESDRDYLLTTAGFGDLADFEASFDELVGRVEIPDDLTERIVTSLMSNPDKLSRCPYPVTEEIVRDIAGC